jgi:hypothetical protein
VIVYVAKIHFLMLEAVLIPGAWMPGDPSDREDDAEKPHAFPCDSNHFRLLT